MLKPQKRSQRKPYVIALHACPPRLASLHSAKLLYPSMILLNHLSNLRILQPLKLTHLQFVRRPVFNVAVFSNYLEYSYQPERFEVDYAARIAYLYLAHTPVAAAVWINLAIAFQLRQPYPAESTNSLEIFDARVPAIEQDTLRRKPAPAGFHQHLAEVVILGRAVRRLVKQPVVTRDVSLAISPHQSDEVYPHNDLPVFARPVTGDKVNLPGKLLVERGVVEDQHAAFKFKLVTSLLPQMLAVSLKAREQAINAIVSRRVVFVWLHASCFCAAIDFGSSNQKINVIVFVALWRIHS